MSTLRGQAPRNSCPGLRTSITGLPWASRASHSLPSALAHRPQGPWLGWPSLTCSPQPCSLGDTTQRGALEAPVLYGKPFPGVRRLGSGGDKALVPDTQHTEGKQVSSHRLTQPPRLAYPASAQPARGHIGVMSLVTHTPICQTEKQIQQDKHQADRDLGEASLSPEGTGPCR